MHLIGFALFVPVLIQPPAVLPLSGPADLTKFSLSGAERSAQHVAASVGWRERRGSGNLSLLPRFFISPRGWTPDWLLTAPSTWREDSADMRTEGTRGKEPAVTWSGRWPRCVEKRGKTQRSFCVFHTGVRRVCWRPPCQDCTALSLSFTPTSSCRGSRPRRHPLLLLLLLPRSTSTSPPPPLLPPRPATQLPTASLTSCHSIPPRHTHLTLTQRCPPTPTQHQHLYTPTPTQHHSDRGSSNLSQSLCSEADMTKAVWKQRSTRCRSSPFYCMLAEVFLHFGLNRKWKLSEQFSFILTEMLLLRSLWGEFCGHQNLQENFK